VDGAGRTGPPPLRAELEFPSWPRVRFALPHRANGTAGLTSAFGCSCSGSFCCTQRSAGATPRRSGTQAATRRARRAGSGPPSLACNPLCNRTGSTSHHGATRRDSGVPRKPASEAKRRHEPTADDSPRGCLKIGCHCGHEGSSPSPGAPRPMPRVNVSRRPQARHRQTLESSPP
jgi:hypothetical protein